MNYYSCRIHFLSVTLQSDELISGCADSMSVYFFPCLFGLKLNRHITFNSHADKELYKNYKGEGSSDKEEGYVFFLPAEGRVV